MNKKLSPKSTSIYKKQFQEEFDLIKKCGYFRYFLIVQDLLDWCKNNNILIGCGRGCLNGETLVLTPNGYIELKNINIGDNVFSHTGEIKKITNKMTYDVNNEKLLKVKTTHSYKDITLTKDHKVWGYKREETEQFKNTKNPKIKRWEDAGEADWIEINKLSKGDLIFTPWPQRKSLLKQPNFDLIKYTDNYELDPDNKKIIIKRIPLKNKLSKRTISRNLGISRKFLNEYGNNTPNIISKENVRKLDNYLKPFNLTFEQWLDYDNTKTITIKRILPFDNDFCYFMGLWIGNGWFIKDSILGMAFNSDHTEKIKWYREYLENLGFETYINRSKTKKLIQIYVYGDILVNLMKSLFPDYKNKSNTKYIGEFKKLPNHLLRSLIKGHQDTDGHVDEKGSKECIDTTSLRLALDVKESLLYLGIPSAIVIRDPFMHGEYLCRESYKVTFLGFELKRKTTNKLIREDGYYSKILNIEETNIDKVYDISVEKDKSYMTSNFAVHNSVTGSLISYLLGITTIDPIKHNLNFGRFLNDGRLSQNENGEYFAKEPPDIDIDADSFKKEEIRKRLETLYGENQIAGITTFLKMENKAVIRDVARTFDVPLYEVNSFSKQITDNIEDALLTDEGRAFANKYPDVIKHALKLRGKVKSVGQHAAGVIVANHDLRNSSTTHLVRSKDGLSSIALSMEDCDSQGMLKLDLLSLSTLSIVAECLKLIQQNHRIEIDLPNINLDDEGVLKDLDDVKVTGIFQAGTWAMANLISEMGIASFNEIVASIALVRPGCMNAGITATYIKRKKGEKWEKKHPIYEKITKDTFSLIIYQEQILDVLTKIAGLPMQIADKIRKIIGKKRDAIHFAPYKKMFLEGCEKMGYFSQEEGEKFWDELQASASYSFSKNHSCAYGKICYDTAYLKHYYPHEFYCAFLTAGAKAKKPEIITDAQKMGLKIMTPKVGVSHATEWIVKNNALYVPFIEVKGIGGTTCEAASIAQKNNGGFFNVNGKEKKSNKLESILDELNAYTDENPSEEILEKYFDFEIILDYSKKYENLKWMNDKYFKTDPINWDDLINCKVPKTDVVRKKMKPKSYLRGLGACKGCSLHEGCRGPVKPAFGRYNVMILGEAPNWIDEKKGSFESDEYSKALFPVLKKAGLEKDMFYLTNIVKCCPAKGIKVEADNVDACGKWFKEEIRIIKPSLILAFGNGAMKMFQNKESGIKNMNGKTLWNEEYGSWVCYCVRPGTAIWGDSTGEKEVFVGLRNFVKTVRKLGLNEKNYR